MFCKYCGNQLKDDAFVCMQCGCETGLHQRALSHAHADKPSVFDAFLYFFFWIFVAVADAEAGQIGRAHV